jgi:hypothetical protein
LNAIDELAGHTSSGFAHWGYVLAAFCALLLAVWLGDGARRREPGGRCASPRWSQWRCGPCCVRAMGGSLPAQLAETLRDLWLAGPCLCPVRQRRAHGHMGPVRPLMIVLAFVEALQAIAIMLELWFGAIEGGGDDLPHLGHAAAAGDHRRAGAGP